MILQSINHQARKPTVELKRIYRSTRAMDLIKWFGVRAAQQMSIQFDLMDRYGLHNSEANIELQKQLMDADYAKLANDVIQKNSPQAVQHFERMVLEFPQIEKLLEIARTNQNVLFVTNELLSKAILRGEFLAIQETRSDDGQSEKSQELERIRIYSNIMGRVYSITMTGSLPEFMLRSSLNLVSLCMKGIFDKSLHVKLNCSMMQEYIGILLPGFQISEGFTNNFNNGVVTLDPQHRTIPEGFISAMRVLVSTLEYVTISSYFKSYYDYRRNIYTFRNSNLPIILNIAIQYIKIFFRYCEGSNWNINGALLANISETLSLLDSLFMYPFSLSLHEYDHELEPNDNITGLSGEIYFPQYFRNVLCDVNFIRNIVMYYRFLLSRDAADSLPDLKKIVRIIGRMASSSGYCFNKDEERRAFRAEAIEFGMILATDCKFDDAYFLVAISDINQKILGSYSALDFGSNKRHFMECCLRFAHRLVGNSSIVLADGKKNPFNSGFQLATTCISEASETLDDVVVKQAAQEILEKGLNRLCDNDQTEKAMKVFGYNNPGQIEAFDDLFSFVPSPFQDASEKNLGYLAALDLSKLGNASKIFWLHLAAILLPSHQAKLDHTKLILKFYELAKQMSGIGSLHYLNTLVEQIMYEMEDGMSSTALWRCIEQLTNQSFNNFLMFILRKCFSNFTVADNAILDYSLEVFNKIYTKLKKHDKPQFQTFYNLVQDLLANINNTVFAQPKFFKRRVAFFKVISVIWIDTGEHQYIYQVYDLIYKQLRESDTLTNFLKYLSDLTGLLQPLENHESFEILAELVVRDLKVFLPHFLSATTLPSAFAEPQFLKAFLRLILSLSSDSSRRISCDNQTQLPLQIHKLFYPYLCQVIKYDLPRVTVQVWAKFIGLHPIGELLPLSKQLTDLQAQEYPLMIREYFSSIHRCNQQEIESLYTFIEGSVEFMSDWWDEVMARELTPQINLRIVVESRIWNNRRQKQTFAKMLYSIGNYNQSYWVIPPGSSERKFVNDFCEEYH